MSPKHKELYETMFKNLTPVEFLKITKIADWIQYKSGEVITQQGRPVLDLNLIYNGTINVSVDNLLTNYHLDLNYYLTEIKN